MMRNREKEMEEHEAQQHEHNHGEHNATTVNTSEAKIVARTFRYMRRKPTIIAYKPPEEDILEEDDREDDTPDVHGMGGGGYGRHHGQSSTSDVFILDRVARRTHHDPDESDGVVEKQRRGVFRKGGSRYGGSKQLNLDKPRITKALSVDDGQLRLTKPLDVYIDGPFGAPTSQIFNAQHAVLIGTGIGVTPFASILQSIMHRFWQARNTCPKCSHQWTNRAAASVLNLRKVDFFWINRDQRSFEWFVNLLSQLEIEQAEQGGSMERFLDMHMYITSALQKTDMKAVGLQLALDLLHKKSKRDLITGLKTRTNAGRPNWDKVFKQISAQKKGKVTLFFCGSPQLGKILQMKCAEFGFDFRKENF
jgi:hypothetical protein